ncbi:MAG: glycosyltransferase family 2 protein [Leptospirillia bacterium]
MSTKRNATPRISVIIPAYNRAATIRRALDSVLAQTLGDFELIVVDDASTDDTVVLVESFSDPRIRLLRHATNRRAAAARNTGIRAARGRYLAFLDSDDEWLPDKLEVQLAALEAAPMEVMASCTGCEIVRNGETFPKVPVHTSHRRLLMGCDLSPGSTLMVRREVFDRVGLNDEAFYRYEDWDWMLRYAMQLRIDLLPQPLCRVYRDGGHPQGAPMVAAAERLLSIHLGPAATRYGRIFARKVAALRWFELSHLFFRERDFSEGARYLLRGLFAWPLVRPGMYLHLLEAVFDIPLQQGVWRLRRGMTNRPAHGGRGGRPR